MGVTLKEFCSVVLTAGAAAIYTPAGAGQVDDARFTNTSGSDVDVTLWRVGSGGSPSDANVVLRAESCAAGETSVLSLRGLVIGNGSTLYALASTAGVVTATLSGREQT